MTAFSIPPEALIKAAGQFNRHEFWESHETLEAVWLEAPEPYKTFLQGLIQAAAGFLHIENCNYIGAINLLTRALEKLHKVQDVPAFHEVMNFADFLSVAEAAFAEVERLGPENLQKFCPGKFPEFLPKVT
jgi:uncharacterized protein